MNYFEWLCQRINCPNDYYKLLKYLYSLEYVWYLNLDENRAMGGLELRCIFENEMGVVSEDVRNDPCSILEMLIALAERMFEQIENTSIAECFWILLNNLNLTDQHDYCFNKNEVDRIIYIWLSNEYAPNGIGGLFPLNNSCGDIRNLDIYSQMNLWIEDNYPHTDEWLY